jgi:hypothetical protein
MDTVSVMLNQAWPTEQGLRRPQEGVITVSQSVADDIVAASAGEILSDSEITEAPAATRRAPRKAKAAPVVEEPEQAEAE